MGNFIDNILDSLTYLLKPQIEPMANTESPWPPNTTPVPIPPIPMPVPTPGPVPVVMVEDTYPPWMRVAKSLRGTKEVPGAGDNPNIIHWAQEIGGDVSRAYTHDSVPWCGLFVAICLKLGLQKLVPTPLWAKAWADYGTNLKEPAFGCIMVFVRAGGGHVAFYVSEDDDYYHILGGNQTDMVNVIKIAKSHAFAFRWPPDADKYFKLGRIYKSFDGIVP